MDFLNLGNPADAIPAIFSHLGEVFHAVEVNGYILSFLLGSFLTDSEGLVDVIDALNFLVMGAVVVVGDSLLGEGRRAGEDHKDGDNNKVLHVDI